MPHVIVEYSANLAPAIDIKLLLQHIHRAALETGVFPIGGMRTRAICHTEYVIADGHPDNGFIHIQARIGAGRPDDVRARAAAHIFASLTGDMAQHMAEHGTGLTIEIVEMAPVGSLKENTLHDHVAARVTRAPSG